MEDLEFINLLKVINDPTRLSIIRIIRSSHSICACKILEELDISQGTLSHHMKLLVENGFVTCQKDGKWCYYKLNKEKINQIIKYLEKYC